MTVAGVEDTGGRIYFQIPSNKALEVGRHRLHLVVKGDLTTADMFIEVWPENTPVFVSDIDGTLTTEETEEFTALLTGVTPAANPNSAAALSALAAKGIRPFYLTARPEWLMERTREFLSERGFPPGIAHTSLNKTGALGSTAEEFKTDELNLLLTTGMLPQFVFGNTESDAAAYNNAAIEPLNHRVFFQFDDIFGGQRIQNYAELDALFGSIAECD